MDQGAGAGLVVGLDRGLRLGQQGLGRDVADRLEVLGQRVGLGVQAPRLSGGVVGPDDQAGQRVAPVADAGDVPPGVGRVGGVDADRGAVDAALRLLGRVGLRPAGVVEDELVGRQRDRLADGLRGDAVGQGGGDRVGGLLPARSVDRLAEARSTQASSGCRSPAGRSSKRYWSSSLGRRARNGSAEWFFLRLPSSSTQNRTDWRSSVWACSLPVRSSMAQARQARTTRWTFVSSWTRYWRSLYASSSDPPASAAKARSAPSMSCLRAASRRASALGLAAAEGGFDRVQRLVRPAPHALDVVGVPVEHLEDRQRPLRSGQLAGHLVGGQRAPSARGSPRSPGRRTPGRWPGRRRPPARGGRSRPSSSRRPAAAACRRASPASGPRAAPSGRT